MLVGLQCITLYLCAVIPQRRRGGSGDIRGKFCAQLKLSSYRFYLDCSKLRIKILGIIIRRTTKKITKNTVKEIAGELK